MELVPQEEGNVKFKVDFKPFKGDREIHEQRRLLY
jgi:hypothetical protein